MDHFDILASEKLTNIVMLRRSCLYGIELQSVLNVNVSREKLFPLCHLTGSFLLKRLNFLRRGFAVIQSFCGNYLILNCDSVKILTLVFSPETM